MPAPKLYSGGGLVAAGDRLREIVAQRIEQRMLQAKAAEEMRRQMVKEAADRAVAEREDKKFRLDERKQNWEMSRPEEVALLGNIPDPNDPNKAQQQFYQRRGGALVGQPMGEWHAPPAPRNPLVLDGVDEQGNPVNNVFNLGPQNQLVPLLTSRKYVAPVRPDPETMSGAQAGVDAEGNEIFFQTSNRPNRGMVPIQGVAPRKTGRTDPTSFERDAMSFYRAMAPANEIIEQEESRIGQPGGMTNMDLASIHNIANWPTDFQLATLSPAGRNYVAAVKQFLMNRGRDLSGASVKDNEWKQFREESIPSAIDPPEARTTKRNYRRTIVDDIAIKAGPAYELGMGRPYVPMWAEPKWEMRNGKLVMTSMK